MCPFNVEGIITRTLTKRSLLIKFPHVYYSVVYLNSLWCIKNPDSNLIKKDILQKALHSSRWYIVDSLWAKYANLFSFMIYSIYRYQSKMLNINFSFKLIPADIKYMHISVFSISTLDTTLCPSHIPSKTFNKIKIKNTLTA